jgi:hypothetical protein
MVAPFSKEFRVALQRERALNDRFRRSDTALMFYSPDIKARPLNMLVREIKRPRWRFGWPMHYRDYEAAGGSGKHLNLHDFATIAIDGVQYVWEIKGGMREVDADKWDGIRKLYISTFENTQVLFQFSSHPAPHENYWQRFPTHLDLLNAPRGREALWGSISRQHDSPDATE